MALQFPLRFWLFCSIWMVFRVIRNEKIDLSSRATINQTNVVRIQVLLVLDNQTSVTVEPCPKHHTISSQVS